MPGAALLLAFAAVTASPSIVTSADPTDLAVTVYRDPNRSSGGIDPAWPRGYALVSETRSIRVPAGESVIRFEGVSEGLMPETAIVAGLPNGVREKNRDARLISPAGLVDAYLKRSVTLRRTNPKTGQVREQQAIIQAGPDGGVVLQTSEGVEALGCWGLPERMLFGGMPEGLSSKPTLSAYLSGPGIRLVRQLCRGIGGGSEKPEPVCVADRCQWRCPRLPGCQPSGRRGAAEQGARASVYRSRRPSASSAMLADGYH
jgi:hypothetical protein